MTSSKQDNPNWRMAAGHMVVAADAASKLATIVAFVQDIEKQGSRSNSSPTRWPMPPGTSPTRW